jgi:hypothetical protein
MYGFRGHAMSGRVFDAALNSYIYMCVGVQQKDEDADEYQNYQMGLEAIDRMAMSLGAKMFMTTSFPLIQQSLANPNPLVRHAGLMCLGEMAEGCNKLLKPHVAKLVECVHTLTFSSSPPSLPSAPSLVSVGYVLTPVGWWVGVVWRCSSPQPTNTRV